MTVASGLANVVETPSASIVAGTPLNVPWPVTDADELLVAYNDDQVAVRGTHYSVTLAPPEYATAQVTPTAALVALVDGTAPVIIRRNMGLSQQYDVSQLFNLPPAGLETALDRTVLYIQQMQDDIAQAVRVSDGEASISRLPSLSSRKGKVAMFDATSGAVIAAVTGQVNVSAQTTIFETRSAVALVNVDAAVNAIVLAGHTTVGDGGSAVFKRVGSEPSHAGKVASGDGAWWEYVPGPEGVNVRAFGAINDGASNDGTAVSNAWAFGWANPAASDGYGVTLFFPAGEYLITTNDVLGNPGVTGQKRFGNIVGPGGDGGAKITFRPTTGNSTFGDDKYFLFDGGDGGVNFNTFHPQFFTLQNLHIYLDKTNLANGDEIAVWRMDGEGASYNLEMHNVQVLGPGTTTTGASVVSWVIQLVGSTNADTCQFSNCIFRQMSHILYSSNPQAVSISFHDCSSITTWGDFFVIEEGALEFDIRGGGWLWADTPDASPQYFFNITSTTSNPGTSTRRVLVSHFKPEMRATASRLVKATDAAGLIEITFLGCNFTGGGITGDRNVTVLNAGKTVKFIDCDIPSAFGHEFTVLDSARGGVNWSLANLGLVIYETCVINGDVSSKITKAGDGGRVIARHCGGWSNGASPYNQIAVDFDSNPFITGHKEPQPWLKTAKLVDSSVVWNGDDAFVLFLPYGCILHRVQAIRYAGTGGTSRTLNITDGDAVTLATDTSTELAGFDAAADISLADVTGLAQRRTTTNKRTITAQITTTLTGNTANGIGYVQYW